ncbi:phosphatase PAP2 family protein [Dokdonia sp. Hel_I_53]|uniref:phosphatase PAP2 family protein n=1 Tax=Dokdonia sp. Hel_I_53 TaxID=1566287 RepID=UPI001199DA5C|nr:phosphatase PAP2 family protein [Dokdonia sp. Hel_I_53]TVZ52193.1 PAP2 superfamily protein [Dokdonia sp. Hel_I_53]
MKNSITLLLLAFISINLYSQSTSPYTWDWNKDGYVLGSALGGTAAGFLMIQNKEGFTEQEVADFQNTIDNINFIDRWAAGNDDESANGPSDAFFYSSFAAPFVLLLDDEVNDHTGQVMGMYVESMAVTGALFTISAGLTNRARPYVYSEEHPLKEQLGTSATRSFFSGHVAATATATFFTAKVYSDFNPDSPAIPYIWAGAAIIPAAVAYYRLEAGQHFPTDLAIGYAVGALSGYFIPELHKTEKSNLNVAVIQDRDYFGEQFKGVSISYGF